MRPQSPVPYILLYATLYGAFGVASPFWPKLFDSKGLEPEQIGWVLATALVVRIAVGPLVGRLADLLASLRLTLACCVALAAATALAFLPAYGFWFILVVACAQAAALGPTTSLADALAVTAARPVRAGKPVEYGWIRGAASAAFLVGTLVTGQLIGPGDLNPIIWAHAGLLVVAVAVIPLITGSARHREALTDEAPAASELRGLLRLPTFRTVIVVAALVYGSHALYDAFAVIMWSDAGLTAPVISVLWGEAVASEVLVFFLVGPWLLNRLGPRPAMLLAAIAAAIRWSIMDFSHSTAVLSMLQPLHGLSFALLHLACMRVMADVVPRNLAATAQVAYAFGPALVTAGLVSVSGTLYERFGGDAFLAMAALCLIALPVAWYGLPATSARRHAPFDENASRLAERL